MQNVESTKIVPLSSVAGNWNFSRDSFLKFLIMMYKTCQLKLKIDSIGLLQRHIRNKGLPLSQHCTMEHDWNTQ